MSNLFAFADAAIALPLRAQIRRILKARTADRATEQQSNRATEQQSNRATEQQELR